MKKWNCNAAPLFSSQAYSREQSKVGFLLQIWSPDIILLQKAGCSYSPEDRVWLNIHSVTAGIFQDNTTEFYFLWEGFPWLLQNQKANSSKKNP